MSAAADRGRRPPARYRQVKDHVLDDIAGGRLRPGDRVASEHELVARLGVSRMTVNRALRELADEGHVVRRAGRGTFVADARARSHVLEVRNIAAEIRGRGHTHATRVLRHESRPAEAALAAKLQLRAGDIVYHSLVVHLEDGVPIQLEDRHVNAALVPGYLEADLERTTANEILSARAPLEHVEHVIRAEAADAGARRWLALAPGEPCLVIERRTWSAGRPVSVALLRHPGSRFELAGGHPPEPRATTGEQP